MKRRTLLVLACLLAFARPAAAIDLSGTVLETIDAESYTYLRLDTAVGKKWAAVSKTTVAKGAKIRVYGSVNMQNFESKTLKRTFDNIVFGSLEAPSARAHGMPSGHGAKVTVPDLGPIKVDKASGPAARTVAELYALRTELKGKEIVLRAKVVKVTPEVMGLNWAHLRDGTGDAKAGDNDLTVTTKETLVAGKVVTLRGKITLDKDLGGRYKFPVLLEDAKLNP
ncbi:MAG: nucleotide-binding protein [Elusimicrobia bacterium]|nr:nucleotide-binding protein [Elusimicrobiota bacterium]